MTTAELTTLNANIVGTQFENARIEGGTLLVDAFFDNSGFFTLKAYPQPVLLNKVTDHGFDQNGYVREQLDWDFQ